MSSFASVKAFGERVNAELDRLDVFIANAGVEPSQFEKTQDGWELAYVPPAYSLLFREGAN